MQLFGRCSLAPQLENVQDDAATQRSVGTDDEITDVNENTVAENIQLAWMRSHSRSARQNRRDN